MPTLQAALERLKTEGGAWRDLLDLAANEAPDGEARELEGRIAQSILRHGGDLTQLRLSPPHCTQSVCLMRGVGAGGNDPRSDWQSLSRTLMNETWFRGYFDDMRTSVSSAGGNVVYVTLYARCAPGTCRSGRP